MLRPKARPYLALAVAACVAAHARRCLCQLQAGVYDFGQGRYGEKRGSWTPGEWLAAILLVMIILAGLALSLGLCYYVTKRQRDPRAHQHHLYRRQQNLDIAARRSVKSSAAARDSGPQQQQQRTPNDSLVVQI